MVHIFLLEIISKYNFIILQKKGQRQDQLMQWAVASPSVCLLAIYKIDFFSGTRIRILMKLHMQHPDIDLSQVCSIRIVLVNNFVTRLTYVKIFERILLKHQLLDFDETSYAVSWHWPLLSLFKSDHPFL